MIVVSMTPYTFPHVLAIPLLDVVPKDWPSDTTDTWSAVFAVVY